MILFVSDNFLEEYVGGAELTTDALMRESLIPVTKVLSRNLSIKKIFGYSETSHLYPKNV